MLEQCKWFSWRYNERLICDVSRKGFIGLKSKMYTFITEDNHEKKIITKTKKKNYKKDRKNTI